MTLCRRTNMRPLGRLVLAAFLLVGTSVVRAQTAQSPGSPESRETVQQFAARTKWWREARFGMFIHWGLFAQHDVEDGVDRQRDGKPDNVRIVVRQMQPKQWSG